MTSSEDRLEALGPDRRSLFSQWPSDAAREARWTAGLRVGMHDQGALREQVIQAASIRSVRRSCGTRPAERTVYHGADQGGRMPITAKLSRNFYDRFGDDVVNELVDWLNSVDLSYRQEFTDLLDVRFTALRQEMAAMELRFDLRLAQVRAELEASIARSEGRLIRWSFAFWLAQLGTMAGLLKLAGLL